MWYFSLFRGVFQYTLGMQAKQDMRTSMKVKLTQMSGQQIFYSSEKIIQQLMPLIDQYHVWSVFLPSKYEPQVQKFIQLLLSKGKQVVVPQSDGNILVPIIYTTESKFHTWLYGIQEIKHGVQYIWPIDIILVPGLAFSTDGKRLGRGMWYYDTFLAQYPKTKKIWLCFDVQLTSEVPMLEHDMMVDEAIAG